MMEGVVAEGLSNLQLGAAITGIIVVVGIFAALIYKIVSRTINGRLSSPHATLPVPAIPRGDDSATVTALNRELTANHRMHIDAILENLKGFMIEQRKLSDAREASLRDQLEVQRRWIEKMDERLTKSLVLLVEGISSFKNHSDD